MNSIPYRCPYLDHKSCDKVDPNGVLHINCIECNHYDHGIRETGAIGSESSKEDISIEEAGENYAIAHHLDKINLSGERERRSFIAGANWQKERSYSKKDIENMLKDIGEYDYLTWERCINWFNQNKKKS